LPHAMPKHTFFYILLTVHHVMILGKWPTWCTSGFGGLGVSALAFGTQVRGFKPGRNRRIFQGEKNSQRAFLRKESKTVGPMSLIYGM
jgi:hypothetical protein